MKLKNKRIVALISAFTMMANIIAGALPVNTLFSVSAEDGVYQDNFAAVSEAIKTIEDIGNFKITYTDTDGQPGTRDGETAFSVDNGDLTSDTSDPLTTMLGNIAEFVYHPMAGENIPFEMGIQTQEILPFEGQEWNDGFSDKPITLVISAIMGYETNITAEATISLAPKTSDDGPAGGDDGAVGGDDDLGGGDGEDGDLDVGDGDDPIADEQDPPADEPASDAPADETGEPTTDEEPTAEESYQPEIYADAGDSPSYTDEYTITFGDFTYPSEKTIILQYGVDDAATPESDYWQNIYSIDSATGKPGNHIEYANDPFPTENPICPPQSWEWVILGWYTDSDFLGDPVDLSDIADMVFIDNAVLYARLDWILTPPRLNSIWSAGSDGMLIGDWDGDIATTYNLAVTNPDEAFHVNIGMPENTYFIPSGEAGSITSRDNEIVFGNLDFSGDGIATLELEIFYLPSEDPSESLSTIYTINVSRFSEIQSSKITMNYNFEDEFLARTEIMQYYINNDDNTVLNLPQGSPSRAGYDFLGWSEESQAVVPAYTHEQLKTQIFNQPTTLYAVYSEHQRPYVHLYNVTDSSNYIIELNIDGTLTWIGNHGDPAGYDFVKWSTTLDGAGGTDYTHEELQTAVFTGRTVLYAIYELEDPANAEVILRVPGSYEHYALKPGETLSDAGLAEWEPGSEDENFSHWSSSHNGRGDKFSHKYLREMTFEASSSQTFYANFIPKADDARLGHLDLWYYSNTAEEWRREVFDSDIYAYNIENPRNETINFNLDTKSESASVSISPEPSRIDPPQNEDELPAYHFENLEFIENVATITITVTPENTAIEPRNYYINITGQDEIYRLNFDENNIESLRLYNDGTVGDRIASGTIVAPGTEIVITAKDGITEPGQKFAGFEAIVPEINTIIEEVEFVTFDGAAYNQALFTMPESHVHSFANVEDYWAEEDTDYTADFDTATGVLSVTPAEGYQISTNGNSGWTAEAIEFTEFPAIFFIQNNHGEISLEAALNKPLRAVTFTASQAGGEPGVSDTTSIKLEFSWPITGLTTDNVSVSSYTGGVVVDTVVGNGDTCYIYLDEVTADGVVIVQISDFGNYDIQTDYYEVVVFKADSIGGTVILDYNYDIENSTAYINGDGYVGYPVPYRPGYAFRGWFIEPECITEATVDDTFTDGDILYAKWEKFGSITGVWIGDATNNWATIHNDWQPPIQTIPYNILVEDNTEEVRISVGILYSNGEPLAAITALNGDEELETIFDDSGNVALSAILNEEGITTVTVTAESFDGLTSSVYTFNFIKESSLQGGATVTLYYNDGYGDIPDREVTYLCADGSVYNIPGEPPVKPGYKFKEWNTSPDLDGDTYTHAYIKVNAFDEDTALYAVYEESLVPQAAFYDAVDPADPQLLWLIDAENGYLSWTSVEPWHDGYFFLGWSSEIGGEILYQTLEEIQEVQLSDPVTVFYANYVYIENPEAAFSWLAIWGDVIELDRPFNSAVTEYTVTIGLTGDYVGGCWQNVTEGATYEFTSDNEDLNIDTYVNDDGNDAFNINGLLHIIGDGETVTLYLTITAGEASKTYTIYVTRTAKEVSFTAEQIGYVLGESDTTAIKLIFSEPVAGLNTDNTEVWGSTGQVNVKDIYGEGDTWYIDVDVVTDGVVTVFIPTFGDFVTINDTYGVNVFKSTSTGDTITTDFNYDTEDGILFINENGYVSYFEPFRPGYVFAGWFNDPECTEWTDFGEPFEAGVTIYAKWDKLGVLSGVWVGEVVEEENEDAYTVELLSDWTMPLPTAPYNILVSDEAEEVVISFGVMEDPEGNREAVLSAVKDDSPLLFDEDNDMVTHVLLNETGTTTVTVTATSNDGYTSSVYTFNFVREGDITESTVVTLDYNNSLDETPDRTFTYICANDTVYGFSPIIPEKPGYIFREWNSSPDLDGEVYTNEELRTHVFEEYTTLYAVYDESTVPQVVIYDAFDESNPQLSFVFTSDDGYIWWTPGEGGMPQYDGYVIVGYSETPDGDIVYPSMNDIIGVEFTEPITNLYAHYVYLENPEAAIEWLSSWISHAEEGEQLINFNPAITDYNVEIDINSDFLGAAWGYRTPGAVGVVTCDNENVGFETGTNDDGADFFTLDPLSSLLPGESVTVTITITAPAELENGEPTEVTKVYTMTFTKPEATDYATINLILSDERAGDPVTQVKYYVGTGFEPGWPYLNDDLAFEYWTEGVYDSDEQLWGLNHIDFQAGETYTFYAHFSTAHGLGRLNVNSFDNNANLLDEFSRDVHDYNITVSTMDQYLRIATEPVYWEPEQGYSIEFLGLGSYQQNGNEYSFLNIPYENNQAALTINVRDGEGTIRETYTINITREETAMIRINVFDERADESEHRLETHFFVGTGFEHGPWIADYLDCDHFIRIDDGSHDVYNYDQMREFDFQAGVEYVFDAVYVNALGLGNLAIHMAENDGNNISYRLFDGRDFNPDELDYYVTVPSDNNELIIYTDIRREESEFIISGAMVDTALDDNQYPYYYIFDIPYENGSAELTITVTNPDFDSTTTYTIHVTEVNAEDNAIIELVYADNWENNPRVEIHYHGGTGFEYNHPYINDDLQFAYWSTEENGNGNRYNYDELKEFDFEPGQRYTFYAHFTTAWGLGWLEIRDGEDNRLFEGNNFDADNREYEISVPNNNDTLKVYALPNYGDSEVRILGFGTHTQTISDSTYTATIQSYETIFVPAGSTDELHIDLNNISKDKPVRVDLLAIGKGSLPTIVITPNEYENTDQIYIDGNTLIINYSYFADPDSDTDVSVTAYATLSRRDENAFNIYPAYEESETSKNITNESGEYQDPYFLIPNIPTGYGRTSITIEVTNPRHEQVERYTVYLTEIDMAQNAMIRAEIYDDRAPGSGRTEILYHGGGTGFEYYPEMPNLSFFYWTIDDADGRFIHNRINEFNFEAGKQYTIRAHYADIGGLGWLDIYTQNNGYQLLPPEQNFFPDLREYDITVPSTDNKLNLHTNPIRGESALVFGDAAEVNLIDNNTYSATIVSEKLIYVPANSTDELHIDLTGINRDKPLTVSFSGIDDEDAPSILIDSVNSWENTEQIYVDGDQLKINYSYFAAPDSDTNIDVNVLGTLLRPDDNALNIYSAHEEGIGRKQKANESGEYQDSYYEVTDIDFGDNGKAALTIDVVHPDDGVTATYTLTITQIDASQNAIINANIYDERAPHSGRNEIFYHTGTGFEYWPDMPNLNFYYWTIDGVDGRFVHGAINEFDFIAGESYNIQAHFYDNNGLGWLDIYTRGNGSNVLSARDEFFPDNREYNITVTSVDNTLKMHTNPARGESELEFVGPMEVTPIDNNTYTADIEAYKDIIVTANSDRLINIELWDIAQDEPIIIRFTDQSVEQRIFNPIVIYRLDEFVNTEFVKVEGKWLRINERYLTDNEVDLEIRVTVNGITTNPDSGGAFNIYADFERDGELHREVTGGEGEYQDLYYEVTNIDFDENSEATLTINVNHPEDGLTATYTLNITEEEILPEIEWIDAWTENSEEGVDILEQENDPDTTEYTTTIDLETGHVGVNWGYAHAGITAEVTCDDNNIDWWREFYDGSEGIRINSLRERFRAGATVTFTITVSLEADPEITKEYTVSITKEESPDTAEIIGHIIEGDNENNRTEYRYHTGTGLDFGPWLNDARGFDYYTFTGDDSGDRYDWNDIREFDFQAGQTYEFDAHFTNGLGLGNLDIWTTGDRHVFDNNTFDREQGYANIRVLDTDNSLRIYANPYHGEARLEFPVTGMTVTPKYEDNGSVYYEITNIVFDTNEEATIAINILRDLPESTLEWTYNINVTQIAATAEPRLEWINPFIMVEGGPGLLRDQNTGWDIYSYDIYVPYNSPNLGINWKYLGDGATAVATADGEYERIYKNPDDPNSNDEIRINSLNFTDGVSVVTITVTSGDGMASKVYTINIHAQYTLHMGETIRAFNEGGEEILTGEHGNVTPGEIITVVDTTEIPEGQIFNGFHANEFFTNMGGEHGPGVEGLEFNYTDYKAATFTVPSEYDIILLSSIDDYNAEEGTDYTTSYDWKTGELTVIPAVGLKIATNHLLWWAEGALIGEFPATIYIKNEFGEISQPKEFNKPDSSLWTPQKGVEFDYESATVHGIFSITPADGFEISLSQDSGFTDTALDFEFAVGEHTAEIYVRSKMTLDVSPAVTVQYEITNQEFNYSDSYSIVMSADDTAREIPISLFVNDPDGDTLTVSTALSGNDEIATVSANAGIITVTPVSAGETEITLTIREMLGDVRVKTADIIIPVTIVEGAVPNQAPIANIAFNKNITIVYDETVVINASDMAIDAEGSALSITAVADSADEVTAGADGGATLTIKGTDLTTAPVTIIVTISDGELTVDVPVSVTVIPITITAAPVTLTAPVGGHKPSGAATAGSNHFNAQSTNWTPDVITTFDYDEAYTATIILKAKANYRFPAGQPADFEDYFTAPEGATVTYVSTAEDGSTLTFTVAYPATAKQVIEPALLDITAPVSGETPITIADIKTDYTGFDVFTFTWTDGRPQKFDYDTVYTATVELMAKDKYTFGTSEDVSGYYDGAEFVVNTGDILTFTIEFEATEPKKKVAAQTIEGLTAPAPNGIPETLSTMTVDYSDYEITAIEWSPEAETFGYSTVYTAAVTLTAKEGYVFDIVANGTVLDGYYDGAESISSSAESLTLQIEFPATSAKPQKETSIRFATDITDGTKYPSTTSLSATPTVKYDGGLQVIENAAVDVTYTLNGGVSQEVDPDNLPTAPGTYVITFTYAGGEAADAIYQPSTATLTYTINTKPTALPQSLLQLKEEGTKEFTVADLALDSDGDTLEIIGIGTVDSAFVNADYSRNTVTITAVSEGTMTVPVRVSDSWEEVTVEIPVEVIAAEAETYTLTVSNGSGSGEYTEGSTVVLTANTPPTGYKFKEWEIIGAQTAQALTTNPITITTIAGNMTAEATYEKESYVLTFNEDATALDGTIPITSGDTVEYGTEVTLTAGIPDEGYEFSGWTVQGVTVTDLTSTEITFNMPANEVDITANYTISAYELTFTDAAVLVNGAAIESGDIVEYNAEVEVTALEKATDFISFTVEYNGTETTEASPYAFTMPNGDVTITANYKTAIAVTAADTVTLTAPAKDGTVADAEAETESEQFTVTSTTWSPDDETFADEGVYTATITLTAEDGYQFPTEPTDFALYFNANGAYVDEVAFIGSTGDTLTFTVTFDAIGTTIMYGDVNEDGRITNADVTRLKQSIAGWEVEISEELADANGDGRITNADVTRLKQSIAGWAVTLGPATT